MQSSTGLQPDQLFIGITKPYAPVQACTIARWVKTVLKDAGINTSVFTAHSTRSASTSAAMSGGASLQKSYPKLTGHHLVLFISTISDHSHFQLFHRLFLRKLQTYMLIGFENLPKYEYRMTEV